MPELPEVETVKNTLDHLVNGKTIKDIDILRAKNIHYNPDEFKRLLIGKTIKKFGRVGKYIVFFFDEDFNKVMVSHLRMEGKYFLRNENDEYNKHDIVIFKFTDGTYLAYNDTRKFGTIDLLNKNNYTNEDPLDHVGPDPFMLKDATHLYEAFKNKNVPIKTMLLDQSIMSGLGNIYVDEVLFLAKVHPETPAKMISKEKLEEILKHSQETLKTAIKLGGSTIKSYHPQEGVSGEFQIRLKVYGKKFGLCQNCGTHLKKIFVGGRGSTFCPNCQKNPLGSHIFGITGPIGSGKSTVLDYFKKHGAITISSDEVVHILYKDEKVIKKLRKIVPNLVVNNGQVDRKNLKGILIENEDIKSKLEEYIHKEVRLYIENIIYENRTNKVIAIEAPLLFEAGLDDLCEQIIFVDIDQKTQKEHLTIRGDHIDSSLAINKSFNYEENKKKSTFVLLNNSSIDALYKKLDKLNLFK